MARVRSASLDDPFAVHMAPPEGETPDQRTARLAAAQNAEKMSRQIDEVLLQSKRSLDKKRSDVKILLLGQSESGKSTVLKNFRLRFTPQYFDSERAAWRMVVLLNLIGSLRVICETIESELEAPEFSLVSDLHRQRCADLAHVLREEDVINKLISPSKQILGEIYVRPGGEWKAILATSEPAKEAASVVLSMRDEIETLWADTAVRELLEKKDISLRDGGGYFMDDVARVTEPDYVPTDSDILRARIKTMGVEEHFFEKESAPGTRGVKDFWIYDVPGSRGSRAAWIPFFDMVQAIVFLTPLSFYEVLEEDTRVNRLEDSVVLWKEICANELLQNCQLILFFNKMDILKAKLRAGLIIKEYVPSFADRPNTYAGATGYFKEKFRAYHKRTSPKPRSFFYYETTAVDTRSTAKIIGAVHEEIFRKHLQESILI
ncbi:G-protein alpha subunit [Mycena albidolilacea]|uniref:G-protein alpha subunit n=1 Tax=Mycena albidolilacea TaxID=1033008 RepID=A0AAD6ZN11_9AGAR|nr:G-protein alpha subunit [Mycena albidolilacea]